MNRARFALVGLLSPALSNAAVAQGPALFPARQYPIGASSKTLTLRDVNGDGHPDAVMASSNTFRVAPGDGAGGFGAPLTYPTGGQTAMALDFADFDNDGLLDPVIGNFGSKDVTILKNAQTAFPPMTVAPFGVQIVAVYALDLDSDGDLDLAVRKGIVSPPPPTDFFVALQAGGTFSSPSTVTMSPQLYTLTFCDVNSDGVLDAVGGLGASVGAGNPRLCIALNSGSRSFAPASPVRRSESVGTDLLTTADLNFDGRGDLLAADNSGKTLYSGLNLGEVNFAFSASTNPVDGQVGSSASVCDLDGNGALDVVSEDGLVFQGDGSGGFGPPTRYELASSTLAVGTGDLDADGDVDAAFMVGPTQSVEVLLGMGTGRFIAPRELVPPYSTNDFAIGRVDDDGLTDVVVGWQSVLTVFLATASGLYTSLPETPVTSLREIHLEDVNLDGTNDAVLARSGLTHDLVEVRIGDGQGGLATSTLLHLPPPGNSGPVRAVVGELNGDGQPDVLAISNANLTRFLGTANGTFGPDSTTPLGVEPVALALGDWDLDGGVDVALVSSQTNQLLLAFGDGAGGFPVVTTMTTGATPKSIVAADFTLDGARDLAIGQGSGSSSVLILTCGAGGVFTPSATLNAFNAVLDVDAGDANGDGSLDVVAGTEDHGSGIVLFLGQGPGNFGNGIRFGSGHSSATYKVRFADVNLDGRLDIVHSSIAEGTFVLTNLQGLPAGVSTFGTGTFGCQGIHGTSANGAPKLGSQDFAVLATNAPPLGDGWLLVGDVPDPVGNDLLNFGAVLYIDPLASSFCQVVQIGADTKGLGRGVFPLPANPGLAGRHLYLQTIWAWTHCPVLPQGFSSSRALDVILLAP